VAWAVAIITGLCLLISALSSGRGHFTTSAHVAARTLSVFSYFQAQALLGMTSVTTPPIVRAWTQNFQWSMGIIRVGFLQRMATWYQRSTGGKAAVLLSSLSSTSVRLQKRTNAKTSTNLNNTIQTLKGIARVSFLASIEITNTFFTSYTWFIVALLFVTIGVVLFKYLCEFLVKKDKMDPTKFEEFRNGWTYVLKGILFRLVQIGFLPMVVLCFWELTRRDSPAEAALAVLTLLCIISLLGWAAVKVFLIARRSVQLHQNPAYMLFSDPTVLNKWGFLYIQYRATTSFSQPCFTPWSRACLSPSAKTIQLFKPLVSSSSI
jgi:hypothetical protein